MLLKKNTRGKSLYRNFLVTERMGDGSQLPKGCCFSRGPSISAVWDGWEDGYSENSDETWYWNVKSWRAVPFSTLKIDALWHITAYWLSNAKSICRTVDLFKGHEECLWFPNVFLWLFLILDTSEAVVWFSVVSFLTSLRRKGHYQHRYRLLEGKVPQQEFLMTDRWISNEGCCIHCQLLGQM